MRTPAFAREDGLDSSNAFHFQAQLRLPFAALPPYSPPPTCLQRVLHRPPCPPSSRGRAATSLHYPPTSVEGRLRTGYVFLQREGRKRKRSRSPLGACAKCSGSALPVPMPSVPTHRKRRIPAASRERER